MPSYPVRVAVAANPNAPPDLLRLLANSKDYMSRSEIAKALVKNPNTPPEVLCQLRRDPDDYVRKAAGGKLSDSQCFIATAVYGSPSAPEVIILKDFRDTFLMKHQIGRLFVYVYYTLSPSVVPLIKERKHLKGVVRLLVLTPFVRLIRKRFPNR